MNCDKCRRSNAFKTHAYVQELGIDVDAADELAAKITPAADASAFLMFRAGRSDSRETDRAGSSCRSPAAVRHRALRAARRQLATIGKHACDQH